MPPPHLSRRALRQEGASGSGIVKFRGLNGHATQKRPLEKSIEGEEGSTTPSHVGVAVKGGGLVNPPARISKSNSNGLRDVDTARRPYDIQTATVWEPPVKQVHPRRNNVVNGSKSTYSLATTCLAGTSKAQ